MIRKRIQRILIFNLLLEICFFSICFSDVVEQITKHGSSLLSLAQIENQTIRQCYCTEQHQCITEMQNQAFECLDKCWEKMNQITKTPIELKKCFARSRYLIESFVSCFEKDGNSCITNQNDGVTAKKEIAKINITELLRLGTEKLIKAKDQLKRSLEGPVLNIIDTSAEFAFCVKDCFVEQNSNGFCFDMKKCQPLLQTNQTKKTLKQCSRIIDFKKEAGELCECSVKAGIHGLEKYCPMLKMMVSKHHPRKDSDGDGQ